MSEHLQIELSAEGILQITFDRPAKKNAFTLDMYEGMTEAFQRVNHDPAVRVLLLCGAGGCFTSGNDLKDFMARPPSGPDHPIFGFLTALARLEKPSVAAVDGLAIGIGTTLLLHLDLVYASSGARFHLPFASLGLCPEAASSVLLPRLMGHHRAAELLLLAEPFSAETARDYGLVNEVVPYDELLGLARAKAQRLASLPPASLRITRALMRQPPATTVEEAMLAEGSHFVERLASPEAREAFTAFFEKRKPDFSRFS